MVKNPDLIKYTIRITTISAPSIVKLWNLQRPRGLLRPARPRKREGNSNFLRVGFLLVGFIASLTGGGVTRGSSRLRGAEKGVGGKEHVAMTSHKKKFVRSIYNNYV
jgi:hypothetical protein